MGKPQNLLFLFYFCVKILIWLSDYISLRSFNTIVWDKRGRVIRKDRQTDINHDMTESLMIPFIAIWLRNLNDIIYIANKGNLNICIVNSRKYIILSINTRFQNTMPYLWHCLYQWDKCISVDIPRCILNILNMVVYVCVCLCVYLCMYRLLARYWKKHLMY